MMDAHEKIYKVLSELGYDVEFDTYTGKNSTYITYFELLEKEAEANKKNVLPIQNENKIKKKVNGTTNQIFFICCQSYFFFV